MGEREWVPALSMPARSAPTPATATGIPLIATVASDMTDRFGFDFSRVRIHPDRADALPPGVLAGTVDESIYFARGAYRPATAAGRHLIAHELAHVVQQRRTVGATPAAGAAEHGDMGFLERDADRAAHAATGGRATAVHGTAPSHAPQFYRIQRRGMTFEVGDVRLNAAAERDVTRHGNLVPSTDQAHLLVRSRQLGYDAGHARPEDPFRWQLIKRIVDREHVDIDGIGETQGFRVKEVTSTAQPTIVTRKLMEIGGSGMTLLTLAHARASHPGQRAYVVSPDDSRDRIVYATGTAGRGATGSNSLAHELFGHLALGVSGAPSRHGSGPIPASAGVRDPFGRPYVGMVDEYVENYAGASLLAGPLESPTFNVGPDFVARALADLRANGAAGLIGSRTAGWRTTPSFGATWTLLSQNYRALRNARPPRVTAQPPTAGATQAPTAATLLARVRAWAAGLSSDRKWVLNEYLRRYTAVIIPTKPQELSNDIQPLPGP